MKKYLTFIVLSILLTLAACSEEKTSSDLTLQSFIDAYEAEGIEVNVDEKPMFSLIQAKDGVIFYIDNQPVKIYEYATEKDIDKGIEALPVVADWNKNGRFVLETSNEKAIEIFNNVK